MKTITIAAIAAAASIALSVAASAATITPISAAGSTSFPGYADIDSIDTGAGAATSDWASLNQGNTSTLKLDLGAIYTLSSASVTDRVTSGGSNNGFVGGLFDFTTQYSLAGYTDGTFTTIIGAPIVVNVALPGSPPASPAGFTTMAALGGLTTRYVLYSVLATQGVNPGLSNISFEGRIAGGVVPEPASWALLLSGFGMVGFAARRQRKAAAA